MYVTWQMIIIVISALSAVGSVIGVILKIHKWYLELQQMKKEIAKLKEEDTLICYALSACLDGLMQLGANHTVPIAKDKLDKFLNQQAHK